MSIPSKSIERIKTSLKRFQPILQSAKARDVNESDTVVIVTDMLEYIFGYDKYTEITSEFAIRGTYCDLAIKMDGDVVFLLEVKAIGLELKDAHVKQAVDYAANKGIEWVGLTNGTDWRIYKVGFGKPITAEIVVEFNLLNLSAKDQGHIELLVLLAKEGRKKAKLEQYHSYRQILNRFTIASIIMSDAVVSSIRRELRRMSPEVKVTEEEIENLLVNEVLKREVIEGDKASLAQKQIARAGKKAARKAKEAQEATIDQQATADGQQTKVVATI